MKKIKKTYLFFLIALMLILLFIFNFIKENFEVIINTNRNTYFIGETININPYFKNNTFNFVKITEYYEEPHYPITIQIFDENNNIIEAIPGFTHLVGLEKVVPPYSKYKSNPINITINKPGTYEIVGTITLVNNKEIIGKQTITIVKKEGEILVSEENR